MKRSCSCQQKCSIINDELKEIHILFYVFKLSLWLSQGGTWSGKWEQRQQDLWSLHSGSLNYLKSPSSLNCSSLLVHIVECWKFLVFSDECADFHRKLFSHWLMKVSVSSVSENQILKYKVVLMIWIWFGNMKLPVHKHWVRTLYWSRRQKTCQTTLQHSSGCFCLPQYMSGGVI